MEKNGVRTTERLKLSPISVAEHAHYFRLFTDLRSMEFSLGVKSAEQTQEWIDLNVLQWDAFGFGAFSIYLKIGNEFIGTCALAMKKPADPSTAEIGYRLLPDYWGKGYATEACGELLYLATDTGFLRRVNALIDPDNVRSIAVVRKLGFVYQEDILLPEYDHPDQLWTWLTAVV